MFQRHRLVAVLLALALVVAACGGGGGKKSEGSGGSGSSSSGGDTTTAPTPPPPPPVYPLTGLPAADPAILARPALVVKIENADANRESARPQSGIAYADLVYEETVEGNITRFACVFHSNEPARVGPVRSFRATDVALISDLNHPLFAWSGALEPWVELARSMPVTDVGHSAVPDMYSRDSGRRAPHNLFADVAGLRSYTTPDDKPPPQLFQYRAAGEAMPAGAVPVNRVDIVFGEGAGSAPTFWQWDPSVGAYLRFQRDTPHLDEDGNQVVAQNLIIQFTNYVESGYVDKALTPIYTGQIGGGSGEAWLLSGGTLVKGAWSKPDDVTPTVYTDATGQPFKLTPGKTWVILPWAGVASVAPS